MPQRQGGSDRLIVGVRPPPTPRTLRSTRQGALPSPSGCLIVPDRLGFSVRNVSGGYLFPADFEESDSIQGRRAPAGNVANRYVTTSFVAVRHALNVGTGGAGGGEAALAEPASTTTASTMTSPLTSRKHRRQAVAA